MINITPIINACIAVMAAIITYKVIPYIKAKTDAEKLHKIAIWVDIAVRAAEQIYTESGMGLQKKKYVIDFLDSKGLCVDLEEIDKLIESTVFNLKQEIA